MNTHKTFMHVYAYNALHTLYPKTNMKKTPLARRVQRVDRQKDTLQICEDHHPLGRAPQATMGAGSIHLPKVLVSTSIMVINDGS